MGACVGEHNRNTQKGTAVTPVIGTEWKARTHIYRSSISSPYHCGFFLLETLRKINSPFICGIAGGLRIFLWRTRGGGYHVCVCRLL